MGGWGGRPALLFGFEESLLLTVWVSVCVTGLILDVCVCPADFFCFLSVDAYEPVCASVYGDWPRARMMELLCTSALIRVM